MKYKTHRHRIALICCCVATIMSGQAACIKSTTPSEPLPTVSSSDPNKVVDEILEKYTAAVGGKATIEQVKSYAGKGTLSSSLFKETGTFQIWGKHPNKTLSVIRFPKGIVIKKGFDGETRWVQTPGGIRTDEGPGEMAEVERDADIYSSGRIKNLYQSMRLEAIARLNGRDVKVVEGKPAKGPNEKLFFDSESGLLLRWDMVRKNPRRGNVFVKVSLDDYKDVDGIKVPFNVRFAFESFDLSMKIEELKHNVPLEDAMFHKPPH
ncbi:MAG: LolA family protein [Pyrinomonadaceae bacterium]